MAQYMLSHSQSHSCTSDLTKKDIQNLLRSKHISFSSKATKPQLLQILLENEEEIELDPLSNAKDSVAPVTQDPLDVSPAVKSKDKETTPILLNFKDDLQTFLTSVSPTRPTALPEASWGSLKSSSYATFCKSMDVNVAITLVSALKGTIERTSR